MNTKMKILALSVLLIAGLAGAQTTTTTETEAVAEAKKKAAEERAKLPKPYNPTEDAAQKIEELVKKAKAENKNIILQAGGNWCIWCLRFNQFVETTPELKQIVDENYLYYHLNFSPENKNEKVFAKYDNPGAKFGYPVFVVLDKDGKMIHTQDSAVLEEGKGYSIEKVKDFLLKWTVKS
ncbi:thioredoxin family protein [Chryseobacterium sp. 6424]|nr:thioredoxin family protein [Chryseobacterium sp. 6424]AYO57925.1 thioredoxin family protein [Chryseobacterium sp. 6424]